MRDNKKHFLSLCLFLFAFFLTPWSFAAGKTLVDIETNLGTMTVELYPDKAPITVANFLEYVNANFYTDLVFHRVEKDFVIQGGIATADLTVKETLDPIINEANNGLSNLRGTIGMARMTDPDSATSQFYFNLMDNIALDHQNTTLSGWGYAVFGQIVEGLDVMDQIGGVETGTVGGVQNFPLSPVTMLGVRERKGQLSFSQIQSEYQVGDTLSIDLIETEVERSEALDLWAGLAMPDGSFWYFTGNAQSPLTTQPVALQSNVSTNQTQHSVYQLTIPPGLTGHYTIYAIFNEPGKDLSQLSQTLRSNIATTQVIIR